MTDAKTVTRLYVVVDVVGEKKHLVEAASPSEAVRAVTLERFTAVPASGMEAARMQADGVAVLWRKAKADAEKVSA
jgi:hypothetical protein